MKPERLQISGFATFRSKTSIDFTGLELFALTGPTGAGKSSVIDAITFALYGVVPRYGKGSVEPVISLGMAEARVRLDFTVAGTAHTAVRVVRRMANGGATTAEARLEGPNGTVSGAREVTAAIEELLGVGVDHFNRSVVLPQGEFAAFLHDRPSGQQELVKALLDLGMLDELRELALLRARTAEALAASGRTRLDGLADATPAAVAAAVGVAERLEALQVPLADIETQVNGITAELEELRRRRDDIGRRHDLARSVKVPAGVDRLASALAAASAQEVDTRLAVEVATTDLEKANMALANLPAATDLNNFDALHTRLKSARERGAAIDLAALDAVCEKAADQRGRCQEEMSQATAQVELIQAANAAHGLSAGLEEGDDCPVCRRPLDTAPIHQPPQGLEHALERRTAGQERLAAAEAVLEAAERERTEGRVRWESTQEEAATLAEQVADVPDEPELVRLRTARRETEEVVATARHALEAATAAQAEAVAAARRLADAETEARREFDDARDRVASLQPPPASRQDLAADWQALADWASACDAQLGRELVGAEEAAKAAAERLRRLDEQTEELLGRAGVGGEGPASTRLALALATARAEVTRVEQRCKLRADLEADVAAAESRLAVAKQLGIHLRSNRFEAWMLAEAMESLMGGANRLLSDLSNDAYSLVAGNQTIEVVDHRNADERRSVKSLSGGETFLVSLALALALGEQLSALSHRGGARLDAIFLDEGFGTLDDETLDTVGAVVAELAARGRMVGLITHVKDLASQMPVRFEIRSAPAGSTIEKVTR